MEKYGCDFTNTFRILSTVSKSPEISPKDQEVLKKIVSNMMPKSEMLKNAKSEYANQPNLIDILKTKPEILRLYGIDPDEVKKEIEQSSERTKEIQQNYSKLTDSCSEEWKLWLLGYK